jgi:DNA invertase Pin-like site-specific DNA recombinase
MSPQKPRRMIGYIRVSRVGTRDAEAENYITEDVQREKIEAWATLRDVQIVWAPVDRDQSGAKLSRPGFDWAMKQIEGGGAEGIVVAQIDRLSRADVADALMIVRRIHDEFGGTVAAVDLGIDPTTEVGEMLLTVLLALARMQWRRYQAGWAASRERAVKRGVRPAATPVGYVRSPDGRLVPDPEEAPAVREAFRLAATQGLRAARDYLRGAGLTTKRRHQVTKERGLERTWTTTRTRALLTNRIYLGEIRIGSLEPKKGAHDPLVDLATWTAASQRAQGIIRPRRPNGDNEPYHLTGAATCSSCGSPLVGNGADRNYRCNRNKLLITRRGEQERCPAPVVIRAEALEVFVKAALIAHVANTAPEAIDVYEPGTGREAVERAEAVLRSAELARDRDAGDLRLRDALGDDAFYARLSAHAEAIAEAQATYDAAASTAHDDLSWPRVDEINSAPTDKLPGLLERCDLVVRVAPGRRPLAERVSLEVR